MKVLPILIVVILFSSCSGTKYLQENEYLLHSQRIKGLKKIPHSAVENSYRQKENKSVFFSSLKLYLNIYSFGKNFYNEDKIYGKISNLDDKYQPRLNQALSRGDTTKYQKILVNEDKRRLKLEKKLYEGNFLMRAGEPPTIFDPYYVDKTIDQLSIITMQQGFPNANIDVVVDSLKRRVKITYLIKENQPLIYDSLYIICNDTVVQKIVSSNLKDHPIVLGENYLEKNLSDEREFVYKKLKDRGYYEFQRQYIYFEVDTGKVLNRAHIYEYIETPEDKKKHIQYKINNVVFQLGGKLLPSDLDTVFYKGIKYIYTSNKYSKSLLNSYIRIRPGELYSLSNTNNTQQRLSEVDVFKYINISFNKVDSNLLDVLIEANPFEKYQLSVEGGVSVRVNQGNGLPGPFIDFSIKDRKIFKGFEIFQFGTRYAIQGQSSASNPGQILRSREIGVNTSISFPKLLIPFKNSTLLLRDYSPTTKIQIGFSDISRPEYERQNFQLSYAYEWVKKNRKFFNLSPLNISFVNTRETTTAFEEYLSDLESNGNNLFQSFEPSFISSILFSYTFNSRDLYGSTKSSDYLNFFIEPGGFGLTGYASLFSQNSDSLFNVPYYQFGRVGVDYRHYIPVAERLTVASRVEFSFARPFGNSETLPYEKFYFSGGSNSNRAWLPRRLGPGSFSENTEDNFRFEQPGEILLETNFEVRKKLISFVYGAWFVDAGNIWTFDKDESRIGSQFKIQNLLDEIAIGSGLGLRFDLSFIILRFDVGAKIRDPARPLGKRLVPWNSKNQFVLNLGIGNPF